MSAGTAWMPEKSGCEEGDGREDRGGEYRRHRDGIPGSHGRRRKPLFADTQNMWKYTDGTLQKVFAFVQNDYLLSEIYGMECTEQGDVELLTDMDSELVLLTLHQADSLPEKKKSCWRITLPQSSCRS